VTTDPKEASMIDAIIEKRQRAGTDLAKRYPELVGLSWDAFLDKLTEIGLELDFITACTMHDKLEKKP